MSYWPDLVRIQIPRHQRLHALEVHSYSYSSTHCRQMRGLDTKGSSFLTGKFFVDGPRKLRLK